MSHPSLLELDRLFLGEAAPGVGEHVEGCPSCAAHLGRCQQPVAVPEWVRELPRPKKSRWWRWAALGVAAAAAFAFLPVRHETVTAKGSPSVAVYLHRASQVTLWDGVQPLRAGDSVQLKVQAMGFSRVTVGAVDGGEVHPLYAGAAQAGAATLLPEAFTLDANARDESLLVVFSQEPLSDEDLRAARAKQPRDSRLWTTVLDLTKAGGTQ